MTPRRGRPRNRRRAVAAGPAPAKPRSRLGGRSARVRSAVLQSAFVVLTKKGLDAFTIAEVAAFLRAPKSAVYSACDRGDLQYVKFEGAVQVEGRDLKAWLASCHRTQSSTP